MRTMPSLLVWLMRIAVGAMLTIVRCWEDRHAEQGDHRMTALNSGLWQADQSLRQIAVGDFTFVPPPPPPRPIREMVPQRMKLADREARELRAVD